MSQGLSARPRLLFGLAVLALALLAGAAAGPQVGAAKSTGQAHGAQGEKAVWTEADKDGFGTSTTTNSKVACRCGHQLPGARAPRRRTGERPVHSAVARCRGRSALLYDPERHLLAPLQLRRLRRAALYCRRTLPQGCDGSLSGGLAGGQHRLRLGRHVGCSARIERTSWEWTREPYG